MKFIKNLYFYSAICFFLFVPFFTFASTLGIAVDQMNIAFDMNEEETQKFVVEVINISDESQTVAIGAMDYVIEDNNELHLSDESDAVSGIKDWISVQDEKIVLGPGQASEIVFTVKTPENAQIGSHRGAAIFRAVPDEEDTLKVQGQIGVHVLINVKGDTHAGGRVNSFDIPILALEPIDYVTEFENTGNIHYVPYGEVGIRNIFTGHRESYKYDKHFVFPGKKFAFSVINEAPSLFGFYKAQAMFVDGEGVPRSKTDYTMGYFFPLIFIGVIGVIVLIVWKLFKKKRRNVSLNSIQQRQQKYSHKSSEKKQFNDTKKQTKENDTSKQKRHL